MLNPGSPAEVRAFFRDAWAAVRAGRPLTPLQDLVAGVIALHPEVHGLIEDPDLLARDDPDTSAAFLHLSLHVAVNEAISADRPPGTRAIHEAMLARGLDRLAAEHRMIEVLHAALETAARTGLPPDPEAVLAAWRRLA